MPVVAYLNIRPPDATAADLASFREGLADMGLVDGKTVKVDYRWTGGNYDRFPAVLADVIAAKADVIVTDRGPPLALAAKAATSTTPIVFLGVSYPVETGLVASLNRPGGNVTGFTPFTAELLPKRLELLCEVRPDARTVALLVNPDNPGTKIWVEPVDTAARARGIQLKIVEASNALDIETAFVGFAMQPVDGLLIGADPYLLRKAPDIARLSLRHRIPAIAHVREFVEAGGLMSYSGYTADTMRQAGVNVGRILKGAKPADLPVQQPSKFEIVINLKTARALGLTIPPSLLARADEVIE